MARTGYKIIVYLDDNPNSVTYMETYEERVEDSGKCPISEDDLILISNECEVGISGYTGYRLLQYYNRTNGEYVYVREEDPECEASSTEEQWVNSGSPYCETTEQGLNTGYMLQLQVQMNINLPNYGETRYSRYKSPECGGNNCPSWEEVSETCHISVANCVATFDGTADIVEIDVNPLSETYNQTRTVNKQDSDCENCTNTVFSWQLVGDICGDDSILCDNGIVETSTNSYTVYRKYKQIGTGTSVPLDEYQVELLHEDDVNCGYIAPQYEMRKAAGQYLCDYETYTKYEKYVQYVSYDSGVTWSVVVPEVSERGDVIAYDSYDCGKPMYRWVPNGEFICEDNGDDGKYIYWDSNGQMTQRSLCDETDILSSTTMVSVSDGAYSEDGYTDTYQVGDCTSTINCSFNGNSFSYSKLWLGNYTEKIISNLGGEGGYNRPSLDIPSKVNDLTQAFDNGGDSSFEYFRTLVMHPLTPPEISSFPNAFRTLTSTTAGSAIFVPNEAYDYYCNASGWSAHSNSVNARIYPMNNDYEPNYKAIMRFKSDFTEFSHFLAAGTSGSVINTNELNFGKNILTSITISNTVLTIKANVFGGTSSYNRPNIHTIDLGNSVETIESGAFRGHFCTSLHIPSSVRTIGDSAFYCGENVFKADTTVITFDEGVETIGYDAFAQNKINGTLRLPDSLQTIGEGAFRTDDYVFNIEHIIIGSGCTSIDTRAFYQPVKNYIGWTHPLKDVTIRALTPPALPNSEQSKLSLFTDTDQSYAGYYYYLSKGDFTIYVPCEAYEDYLDSDWALYNRGYSGQTINRIQPYGCSGVEVPIAVLHLTDGTDVTVNKPVEYITKALRESDIEDYSTTTSSITINSNCNKVSGHIYVNEMYFTSPTPPQIDDYWYYADVCYVPCQYYPTYMTAYEGKYVQERLTAIDDSCLREEWREDSSYCDAGTCHYAFIERKYIVSDSGEYATDETRHGERVGDVCLSMTNNGFEETSTNKFENNGSGSLEFEYLVDGGLTVTIHQQKGARPYFYVYANTSIYYGETRIATTDGSGTKDVVLESHKRYTVKVDQVRVGGVGGITFKI